MNSTILPLLLAAAAVASAASNPAPQTWFVEKSSAVGLDFVHYNGMTGKLYYPEMTGGSVALLDYDNDGDLDVYFGQGTLYFEDTKEQSVLPSRYPHPVTDRLYRNDLRTKVDDKVTTGPLRFTDVTTKAGLAAFGNNMGVVTADVNNDGWVDLYLTNVEENVLLLNNGDGTFKDFTEASGTGSDRWSAAASFFDYDRDGWLDLMIGDYVEFRKATVKQCSGGTGAVDYCGPQSYPPLDNKLLRNVGDGKFEDVTVKALVDAAAGSTLGLVSADFDADGWIDIYVANDLMANDLWINQKNGTFLNDAMFMGAAVDEQGYAQASMGVVAGDLNGDGTEDLFMAHLAAEMNTLYTNDGTGMFEDGSRDSGLGMPSWEFTGFGAGLGDFNNDGLMDLYLANGAVKRVEAQMRNKEKHPLRETNLLFRGVSPGSFEEVPAASRVDVVHSEVSRGVGVGDLDNDGALDLVVANNAGQARLLHNVGTQGDWIGFAVKMEVPRIEVATKSASDRSAAGSSVASAAESADSTKTRKSPTKRDALGARVSLHWQVVSPATSPARSPMVRRVRTDGSFASARDPRVHFGLGEASAPDWIEVVWPDGSHERFGDVAVGRYSELVAGQGQPVGAVAGPHGGSAKP